MVLNIAKHFVILYLSVRIINRVSYLSKTESKVRNNISIKNILIQVFACFCIIAVSCTPAQNSTADTTTVTTITIDPVASARQKIVDSMYSLTSGYTVPDIIYNTPDYPRLEGWFDVNEYFSLLTRLSMRPGYTLDYVYHNMGSGAQPYLYARKVDSKPYSTLEELAKMYNDQTYIDTTKNHAYDYLGYVQTDGTEEAFFQYVVLRIMGGQFYLWWHAAYNDKMIICDQTGLDALFSDVNSYSSRFGQTLPSEVQDAARRLDFTPKVEITSDTVTVRVVVFTKWGGFIEETYTIVRAFPHIISDIKTKTIVPWQINLTF
jgi:hypothetical protein